MLYPIFQERASHSALMLWFAFFFTSPSIYEQLYWYALQFLRWIHFLCSSICSEILLTQILLIAILTRHVTSSYIITQSKWKNKVMESAVHMLSIGEKEKKKQQLQLKEEIHFLSKKIFSQKRKFIVVRFTDDSFKLMGQQLIRKLKLLSLLLLLEEFPERLKISTMLLWDDYNCASQLKTTR